ncbi:MAG: hypothetical protein ACKOZM_09275 [Flavobacteriales bacterium]
MQESTFETLLYIFVIVAVTTTGLILYRKEIAFLMKAKRSEGKIVNWMSTVIGGKRYFYPMIEFTPPGFEKQLFRAEDRCEGVPLFEPGTTVTVKYLESDIEFRKVIYPKK